MDGSARSDVSGKTFRRGLGLASGIAAALLLVVLAPMYPAKGRIGGFDEVHYLALLRDGWSSFVAGSTMPYYVNKSLPFLIVNAVVPGYPDARTDLLASYARMLAFDAVYLALALYLVARVLRRRGKHELLWVGGALLLCSRAFLNFYVYYPRLPDVFVLALGGLFAVGHFERRPWLVWTAFALSLFSCPQLVVLLALYLSFSRDMKTRAAEGGPGRQLFWALAICGPAVAGALWAYFWSPRYTVTLAESWGNVKYFRAPLPVGLSVAAMFALFWYAVRPLRAVAFSDLVRSAHAVRAALAALAIIGAQYAILTLVPPGEGADRGRRFLAISLSFMLSKPAPALMSWVLFYGTLGALLVLRWTEVARWIGTQGPGFAFAVCVAIVFFALDSEVRHAIFLLPVLVVGVCEALEHPLRRRDATWWIWLGVLCSLNWLLFLHVDPSYRGLRMLSGFGMIWSPVMYACAVGWTAATLWCVKRLTLEVADASSVESSPTYALSTPASGRLD